LFEKARELGFDFAGVVPTGPAPHADEFNAWLANGHAGEMTYLNRTAEKRRDARLIFPGVRSIVVLGWNYHLRELPEEVRQDPARGLIASYAWGDDYHDVLRPLLEELADFISHTGRAEGPPSRARTWTPALFWKEIGLRQRAWVSSVRIPASSDLGWVPGFFWQNSSWMLKWSLLLWRQNLTGPPPSL